MANYIACVLIFRIVLPLVFGACVCFRPSALSAVYFLFLLLLPIVPVPTRTSMQGSTGIYLKILVGISIITFILQIAFQIVLLAMPPYGNFLENCEFLEKVLRHVGFVRLDQRINFVTALTWLSPELLMVASSIAALSICKKLCMERPLEVTQEASNLPQKASSSRKQYGLLVSIGKYCVLLTLCLAAVLRPSVTGALYFIIFLSTATWWSCYKQLRKGFAILMRCLMVIVILHMICLYAYQFQWPQELLPKNATYARYFGLTPILYVNCTNDPRDFYWATEEWATYVNPVALFLLYYVLALESKVLLKPQSKSHVDKSKTKAAETTPLIRGVSPSRRYGSGSKKTGAGAGSVLQDSTGSVTVTGDNPEDIPLDQLEEDYKPTVFENIMFAMETLLQFIIRSSYIVTNIIMMAWSITYLSWITFVLLLWANLLWLVPNQRKSMLRSSPFLVFYAWFLLLSAYIYSMNLTEEELPSTIQGINLAQIGFQKVTVLPCNPLMVKCLFTAMFWITLRQYMQERLAERQSSALADMVAPLQVTVGTATGVKNEQEQGSKIMEKIGIVLRQFLTKFWIWIVATTLFTVAITGERMTGFRILYMALFLFFILSFQLSFRLWRKMMFGFWLTVIVYSMLILVMVYTYQFDNFKEYWSEYLHVPEQQQLDIGLEKFETKQLFVRLVTPTFFVIITVVQLHYFHKDFMEISDPKSTSAVSADLDQSSLQGGAVAVMESERDETTTSSIKFDQTESERPRSRKIWLHRLRHAWDVMFIFLELHLPKFVLVFLMLVCIYDKCALYLILVILIVLALTIGRPMQVFAIYSSSVFVSIMLLARMIYQIQYIEPYKWNVTCEQINTTENNAKWLGFTKTQYGRDLPYLVKWNIIYVLIVTLWSVVLVRQYNDRISKNKPTTRAFFIFPRVTRLDADKNLSNCLKYLANYGFYKFGVEISLMATVALIGYRMDMYSIVYSMWLCVLFKLERNTLAKVWNFYMAFIAVVLPLQYVLTVGLPPTLCMLFPWDKEYWDTSDEAKAIIWRRFQDFAYLLDKDYPPSPKKLICDFILLLCVSRQSVVFRIEKRNAGHEYPGGSNESIIHHPEERRFVNPVPDYITYVRTYLDVIKRAIFLSFMWITLAIVFLAGTNRVNVFSIGYLCGAFVFLWQGSDLYLRPIPKILKAWNVLLGYNVAVILVKTALQILGCIFVQDLPSYSCWPVQVFGIGCVKKFGDLTVEAGHSNVKTCVVARESVGLVWDGLCFGFLIMQRRIFQSYNFFHMINEAKAATILASRGAELIEELRQKRMREQEEQERNVLDKIKAKMDRIKANQQKIQGASFKDSTNHYADTIFKNRPRYRRRSPKSYKEAVRSGDYYMFEDLDDEELDFMEEVQSADEEESKVSKPTVGEIEEHTPRSVTIIDERQKEEPRPGTSKDDEISEITEPKENVGRKILNFLLFIWAFIESLLISLTNFLNRYSRDYRYVLRVLAKEKRILKENTDYSVGLRLGTGQVWQPAGSYHSLLKQSRITSLQENESVEKLPLSDDSDTKALATTLPYSSEQDRRKASVLTVPEIRILAPSLERGLDSPFGSSEQGSQPDLEEYEGTEMSSYDQPTLIRLGLAIWYIIMSHSEILCYFMIFLNQIKSATFLSLPLPLMVFLWGTLTIPRPSKTFWVTIIAYTEVIVLIKCMFQFDIIPWNKQQAITNDPFYPPRIIGIEKNKNYAIWDLLLLLVVFFHRSLLKSMGLWKASGVPAALLKDGDYRVTSDGQLSLVESVTKDKGKSKLADQKNGGSRELSVRKDSDLQRLVEETEEHEDKGEEEIILDDDLDDKIVSAHSENVSPLDHFPKSFQLALGKYGENFKIFFKHLLDPTSRVAADVYSYMFLCDFFNFFVILIGYNSFGTQQGDGGVSSYLEDNRVPTLFLLMLILQFTLIIVDRGIFLRKNILAKILFQFITVVFLHIWLFIIFPIITEKGFNSVLPPQMYYMVKSFYLLLSAYQIRCGYPTRILGNFLCKGYNYLNMFLFKGFMAIPFLFELRTVMDWMWTDTSMTVFDWIKMEDIFAHIFQLKCNRHVEDEYPQPRGEKKNPVVKYFMGGFLLFIIIAIIWFPLVFFSLGNAVGKANPPYDLTLEIRIGPYEPVYQMSAQSNSIYQFTESNLQQMQQAYIQQKSALSFISNYESDDIAAVKLSSYSANIWSISPPDRQRMVEEVKSDNPLSVRLEYKVSHKTSKPEDSGVIPENVEISIPAYIAAERNPMRHRLLEMLSGNKSADPMILDDLLPKFIKVTNRGTAKIINQLMQKSDDQPARPLRTINLALNNSQNYPYIEWWKINENCSDDLYNEFLSRLPYKDCDSIIVYSFNDKIFPSTLSIITAGGIVGLYTTLVFVAWRFLRGFFAEQCFKIMFEDMPNIDRVLQLCLDIYLVREAREFALEEDLFAKLVFLFRSPETLIKWTRPKEELADDEDPEAEDS